MESSRNLYGCTNSVDPTLMEYGWRISNVFFEDELPVCAIVIVIVMAFK